MVLEKNLKKHALFLFAVFGLFFTQLLFFYDEINFGSGELFFAASIFVVFFVFLTLSLLGVPPVFRLLWIALGYAAIWVIGNSFQITVENRIFAYISSAPIVFFVLSQERFALKEEKNLWSVLLSVYPVLLFVFLIFSAIRDSGAARQIITAGVDYGCFLFPALIVLFVTILCTPRGKSGAKNKTRDHLKEDYLSAVAIMLATFLLQRFYTASWGIYIIPLFWSVSLLVLFEESNPLILDYRKWIVKRVSAFLGCEPKA